MAEVKNECLQAERLKAAVASENGVCLDVTVHPVIDSTNSWCMQQNKAGKALPFACFAEEQTAGRGRRGKSWLMLPLSNIAMSISWPFDTRSQVLQLLPLSIALAIVKTLENLKLNDVQIKWPNDVYVRGRKIAGILIETQPLKNNSKESGAGAGFAAVVIGIGLNYDMSSQPQLLAQQESRCTPVLTDICTEFELLSAAEECDRAAVAAILLRNIIDACQNFQQEAINNLEKLRKQYDYCKNKTVEIITDNKETLIGVAQGINDRAELIVMVDGIKRCFNSAEVSVRAGTSINDTDS